MGDEGDLRAQDVARVSEGELALGAGVGHGGGDGRAVGNSGCSCADGSRWAQRWDAVGQGGELGGGEIGEAREVIGVGVDLVVELDPQEMNLCDGAARLEEFDGVLLTGVEALLDDGDEASGEAVLGGEGGFALLGSVEGDVGDRDVLLNDLAGVLEGEVCGLESGAGGTDVVPLRVVEEQRLRAQVEDGGLAEGKAVRVTET